MEYLTHQGITYELTVLAFAHEDGFGVELTDMSSAGGLLAEARVRRDVVSLVHQDPMPAAVYAWWASAVIGVAGAPALGDESGD